MKRLILSAVLGIVAVAMFAPAGASAAEFDAYVGCGTSIDTPPATTCELGGPLAAFFKANDEDVEYEVCVEYPDLDYLCAPDEAAEGVLKVNAIGTDQLGEHWVDWFVGDVLVATTVVDIVAPAPPTPPLPPVVPPAPPAPIVAPDPGPSPACKKAKQKVKTLSAKLGDAEGKKAKAKIRPKLKEAKGKKKRFC